MLAAAKEASAAGFAPEHILKPWKRLGEQGWLTPVEMGLLEKSNSTTISSDSIPADD